MKTNFEDEIPMILLERISQCKFKLKKLRRSMNGQRVFVISVRMARSYTWFTGRGKSIKEALRIANARKSADNFWKKGHGVKVTGHVYFPKTKIRINIPEEELNEK